MKLWALFAFLAFSFPPTELNGGDRSKYPHITNQRPGQNGERILWIHNPLPKAVWIWLSCEDVVSIEPIGLAGDFISEIHLTAHDSDHINANNFCEIDHWKVQKGLTP